MRASHYFKLLGILLLVFSFLVGPALAYRRCILCGMDVDKSETAFYAKMKNGKMIATPKGRTYWIDAEVESELAKEVEKDLREKFMSAYTIAFENYPVSKRYLHRSAPIKIEATS